MAPARPCHRRGAHLNCNLEFVNTLSKLFSGAGGTGLSFVAPAFHRVIEGARILPAIWISSTPFRNFFRVAAEPDFPSSPRRFAESSKGRASYLQSGIRQHPFETFFRVPAEPDFPSSPRRFAESSKGGAS